MVRVAELLERARVAGLTVGADGPQIVIRGPKRLAALANELLEHKDAVREALCTPSSTKRATPDQGVPVGLVTEDTYATIMERLARADGFVVDLETTGLDTYHGDRLCGIAIADALAGPAAYFPFRHQDGRNLPLDKLFPLLDLIVSRDRSDQPRSLGGHNFVRFDCAMLATEGSVYADALLRDDRIPKWDTMVAAFLVDEHAERFALEALGPRYLGDGVAKPRENQRLFDHLRRLPACAHVREKDLKAHVWKLPPEFVADYACGDVTDCRALQAFLDPHLAAAGLTEIAADVVRFGRLLARMERRGVRIDRALAEERVARLLAEAERTRAALHDLAGPRFNPNSPRQVTVLLDVPNAQEETLARSSHPAARLITRIKRLGKMKSVYAGILERLDASNRIHPQWNLTPDRNGQGGTRTGRLSCSRPNFQNLPKRVDDPLFTAREVIIPEEGQRLLVADYERAEMWMGAHYSRDRALWDAYHAGRDLYQELANRIGCSRADAKRAWLAIQYGAGDAKLAEQFGWSFTRYEACPDWETYRAQQSVRLRHEFFALCPGIKANMKQFELDAARQRALRLWTGRICRFDEVSGGRTETGAWARSRFFTAWNHVIQGGVAEIVRVAMQRLEEPLDAIGAHLILQVHDEVVVEAPADRMPEAMRIVQVIMTDFPLLWLRPRVEVTIGHRNYAALEPLPLADAA